MRVNTDELERQADDLRNVARRVNEIQDSVLRIARNLGREQFGERFRYPLNDAAVAIGRRGEELTAMRKALRQIAQLYERTEMDIVDEAEHASVHHQQSGVGAISIPDIQDIISNPGISRDPNGGVSWDGGSAWNWIQVPPVVPIGVTGTLRELLQRMRARERIESIMDETLDTMEDIFRDQYGPTWISEGSAQRLRMRAILEEMVDTVREGVTPDLNSVAEEAARAVRDGISSRIPSLNEQRTAPQLDIPSAADVWDGINHDGVLDNTPPVGDIIRDGIDWVHGGYVPPELPDLPTIDPSSIFEGSSIPDGLSGGPSASLDPVGPGMRENPFISSIDIDAGMRSIAGDVPTMGEAIAGGVGAIDWTPWNP